MEGLLFLRLLQLLSPQLLHVKTVIICLLSHKCICKVKVLFIYNYHFRLMRMCAVSVLLNIKTASYNRVATQGFAQHVQKEFKSLQNVVLSAGR